MAKQILLVEDDQMVRELYAEILRDAGYKVYEAVNGEDGLRMAGERSYDLVLLDIMLPKLDGLAVLKGIKENEATKQLPVVLLTNLGRESIIKEGFTLGADGYLIKSEYNPEELLAEIDKFLKGSGNAVKQ